MDFMIQDSNDIASGTTRRRENEQMNAAVQAHNSDIANNINTLKTNLTNNLSQMNESETLQEGVGAAKDLMGASGFKDSLKDLQRWSAKRGQPSKTVQLRKQLQESPNDGNDVRVGAEPNAEPITQPPENSTPSAPAQPTPEGSPAQGNSNPAPTADDSHSITAGADDAAGEGSSFRNGIKTATGLTDDTIDKLGKTAGVAGAAVTGGLDIFQDIKAGKIAGDNGWEKAANVTQIGGSILDIAGAVPVLAPLAVVGSFFDLLGGGLDAIGEAVEGSKAKDEAKQKEQAQEKAQQAQIEAQPVKAQAPIAVAKVQ